MRERRTYVIEGGKEELDELERALWYVMFLGKIGSSRTLVLWVDGDGSARLKISRTDGKELNKPRKRNVLKKAIKVDHEGDMIFWIGE